MKLSEYMNTQKVNTPSTKQPTQKPVQPTAQSGNLSAFMTQNNVKPAQIRNSPKQTPAPMQHSPFAPQTPSRGIGLFPNTPFSPAQLPTAQPTKLEIMSNMHKPYHEPNPSLLSRIGNVVSGAVKDTTGSLLNIGAMVADPFTELVDKDGTTRDIQAQYAKDQISIMKKELADSKTSGFRKKILQKSIKDMEVLLHDDGTLKSVSDRADDFQVSSAEDISDAKQGLGKVGSFTVDAGVGLTQLAGDVGVAAATGGTALLPMALRSFGGGAQDARQSGADLGQQVAYGALSAGTAVLVEKISNVGGALSKAYGKGALDDVLESATSKAIAKFVSSETGQALAQRAVGVGMSGLGEGLEEVIESILDPLYRKLIFDPDAKWNAEDILYDGLVGGAIGLIAGGNPNNNRQANRSAQDVVQSPSTIAPTLQNMALEADTSPTVKDSLINAELPTKTESAVQSDLTPVAQQQKMVTQLEQDLEYELALNRNLYAEYRSTDPETRRPELLTEAAEQRAKVRQAKEALQRANDGLNNMVESGARAKETAFIAEQQKADIAEVSDIISDLDNRFINEETLSDIESIGAMESEVKALRKAFDRASRLQQGVNKLRIELDNAKSLDESIDIQQKLDKAISNLEKASERVIAAQNAITSYAEQSVAQPATTKSTTIFPESSLGAKITGQNQQKNLPLPKGAGAASKGSVGGMGPTKSTRFAVNDDMNVNLDNLPEMSNKVVMNPKKQKQTIKTKLSNMYTRTVDKLNPIVKFSKAAGDNTAMLASNAVNAGGTVSHIIDDALVDMNGNKIGKSLTEAVAEIPKSSQADFWNYVMHRRNITRAVTDTNVIANYSSSMSAQYAENTEAQHPEWRQIGDEIVEWLSDFNQAWSVDSGLVDQLLFDDMKNKDPNYVPAQREFSETESALTGGDIGQKFVDQRTPLKRMEGSERDINNPVENIMRLVNTTVKTARYNQVGHSLLNTLQSKPMPQYAEIISEQEAQSSKGNNIVFVLENGQKQYIKVNDIDLLEALKGMPKTTDTLPVLSSAVSGFKKVTTQDNPLFGFTNFARDLPTGYIYGSQINPFAYLLNEVKAFGQIAKNGEMYQKYKAVGGGMSSFFSSANAETAALNLNKTKNVFQKVGMGINKFNSAIEEATRLNEFSAVFAKTGDVQKALHASNEVTVNFARGGDVIKRIDRNAVPYLNASIQGLDKLGKAFKPDKIAKTLFSGVVGVTLPTLIMYLFNRDNPYYDELSNRIKDTYYVIPNLFGDKDDNDKPMTFFKIPKSRELGMLFGSLAERIARAVDGEEEAFKGLVGTFATNIAPTNPIESGIVGPFIGLRSNKDFAGRTIVPQSMQDRSPHLQFDERTSELTKFIAEHAAKAGVELSPKEMDYLIDSWTGVVGDFLLPVTTKGTNALSPITNRFTADPRYSSQTISDFYDKMDEAAQKSTDKTFSEGLDSKAVTIEKKISSNYSKASKEISALSKAATRAGVKKLTTEDIELLREYGIDTSKKPEDIQKAVRTEQNKIASAAISRGTKANEMELDLNNDSGIAKSVEKYQSAGITKKQAYSVYQSFDALKPEEGEKQVTTYQKVKAISGFGYSDEQAIALAGTLYTTKDDDGAIKKESLLPYLNTSKHLLSLYLTNKDSEMISMTIPETFTSNKVEYTLDDAEKELFKSTYVNYFNAYITNVSGAKTIKSLRDKAYNTAKTAVIQSR